MEYRRQLIRCLVLLGAFNGALCQAAQPAVARFDAQQGSLESTSGDDFSANPLDVATVFDNPLELQSLLQEVPSSNQPSAATRSPATRGNPAGRGNTARRNPVSLSSVQYMIGDGFGGLGSPVVVTPQVVNAPPGLGAVVVVFAQGRNVAGTIPSFSGGGGGTVGQTKLAEGFNPIPRDRVFINYSFFNTVPLTATGLNVNRYTPGFEKTFFDGLASFEMRTPFAGTLSSSQNDLTNPATGTEFGDLFMSLKVLLASGQRYSFAGGMSFTAPTARDIQYATIPQTTIQQLRLHNDAVHLLPYGAFLWTPNERFYSQALVQLDVPTSGSRVTGIVDNQPDATLGTLTNQTLYYASLSAGYWLFQNRSDGLITGLSPVAEFHYNQTLSSANSVTIGGQNQGTGRITIGSPTYQFQLLNATVGANAMLGPMSSLLLGYTTPIGSDGDRQFNGEFRLVFVRRFGPQSRATRVQF